MVTKYVLDTHALVWFVEGNRRLSETAIAIIAAQESQLVLPLIALAEAVVVIERGRTTIPSVSEFLARVHEDTRIEIFPFTLDVFERSLTPESQRIPELHDRIIVSTALHLQDVGDSVALVTTDRKITEADVLSIIW